MQYCATNQAILSGPLAMPLEGNPVKEFREALGFTQEDLAILAAPDLESRPVLLAVLRGIEAGTYPKLTCLGWSRIKEVFVRARFNVKDLEKAYVQWGKELDESIDVEVEFLVGKGMAERGPK
jgi:hypothetical protein